MADENLIHAADSGGERVPKKKENASTNQPNPEPKASDAPIAVSRPEPNFAPSERHNCCKKYKRIKEEIKFWFEIAGIIAGIGVLILLWKQYGELVKTTQVAVGQLKVMKTQSDAMQGQLQEMQTNRNLDERAWLFVYEITNAPIEDSPSNGVFFVTFKNYGRTPAFHVHGSIAFTMDATAIPKLDFFTTPHTDMTVAPDGTSSSGIPMNAVNAAFPLAIQAMENGKPSYFFGAAWYDDIFGKHHWTQFCYVMQPGLKTFKDAPFHNECDDTISQNHTQ